MVPIVAREVPDLPMPLRTGSSGAGWGTPRTRAAGVLWHAFEVMRVCMLGRGLIQAVEEVCVEDLVCPAGRLGDLRTAPGMVAAHYGYGGGRHSVAVPRRHWKNRHIPLSERAPLTEDEKFVRALVDRKKYRETKGLANST